MSNDKMRATGYEPPLDVPTTAHAELYENGPEPLPRRTPFEHLAAWGEPPPPDAVPDRMHYESPGRAPWAAEEPGRRRFPAWAWVSIVLGVVLLVCGSSVAVTMLDQRGPAPVVRIPATAPVTTSGTCEKRIVGEYGLVATVRATNTTDTAQTGVLWVRWPVTGEAAQEFVRRATLAPGESVELPVSQKVSADLWFRTGACSYGWTSSPN